jgi:hypothetical protein
MSFIRELFSDEGKASFSRFGTFLLLLGTLFWVSYLVVKKETMPDLASLTLLLVSLYGVNKAASAVEGFKK